MKQALLLRATISGITVAMLYASVLFLPLTPLPLILTGLSGGRNIVILAVLCASTLIAILDNINASIAFIVLFGLPSIGITQLALRKSVINNDTHNPTTIYYPINKILIWVAGIAGIITCIIFLSYISYEGGFIQMVRTSLTNNQGMILLLERAHNMTINAEIIVTFVNIFISSTPAIWTICILGNLQGAQTLAEKLKINIRPHEDYNHIILPLWFEIIFATILIGGLLSTGWISVLLYAIVGLCITVYFLLGLIVIHAISHSWWGRFAILFLIYTFILLVSWIIIPISVLGLMESRFNVSKRLRKTV